MNVKVFMETKDQVKPKDNGVNLKWLDDLDKNNVRVMALDPTHDLSLIDTLNTTPKWVIEFEDEDVVFYYREDQY